MAVDFSIPRLGTVGGDATIVEWAAKEGEKVEEGAVVLVIETQKIKFDIAAEMSGFLNIIVEEGVECPIGTIVGMILPSQVELARVQKERPLVSSAEEARKTVAVSVSAPDGNGSVSVCCLRGPDGITFEFIEKRG